MRERLRIGEVARLVGVTPKTVRYYEKIGLLKEVDRSGSGYRLYSADDLLRLQRVRKLQSLGLSLRQVGSVLGEGRSEASLRDILKALRAGVDSEIGSLKERRRLLDEMLSRDELETAGPSPTFERAMELLGKHLVGLDEKTLEQEKKLWSILDAFEWPEDYDQGNERLFRYYADHPGEYRDLLVVGERLSSLADLPEDDPRVVEVAEELVAYFEKYPPPEYLGNPPWTADDPTGRTMIELMLSSMSPAQQRVMALIGEWAEAGEKEDAGA
ncbi:MerR family transcriptional regulator [Rubrobacter tropicus]|uniref:MerR family transcriptional regulator n=1 Tax=Rubrobacter tropicus TaxID=2653851 RepID=A0A6G8Q449_9ACTN|nr:MerR family transcriptional regulator [Rubrobacter tropicus]QIN81228.1 MerR family transcriptional regulator [Rubrobacter tropicus]